ncbi:hypothetical protein GMMP15_1780008 [Candidatus Magnetomoraceae bacterium gMMP-15]
MLKKFILLLIGINLFLCGCSGEDPNETMINESNKFKLGWLNVDTKGDNPEPRYFHSMAKLTNGKVLLFGGSNQLIDIEVYNDTWIFEEREDGFYWRVAPNDGLIPEARWKHKIINIDDGKVLLFGGVNISNESLNDVWLYDYDSGWEQLSDIEDRPSARCLFGFSRISDDTAILLGGYDTITFKRYNDTWLYNFSTNVWTKLDIDFKKIDKDGNEITDCLKNGISDFELSQISNNAVFFYSGFTWIEANELEQTYYRDSWIFNLNDMEWEFIPYTGDFPGPRQLYTSAYLNNDNMFLFGGVRIEMIANVTSEIYLSDTWIFNYDTNTWDRKTFDNDDSPEARFAHSSAIFETSRIVLFGGIDANRNTLSDTWVYTFLDL